MKYLDVYAYSQAFAVKMRRPILLSRGRPGVENLLEIFSKEMRVAMILTGVTSIDQIDRSALVLPE